MYGYITVKSRDQWTLLLSYLGGYPSDTDNLEGYFITNSKAETIIFLYDCILGDPSIICSEEGISLNNLEKSPFLERYSLAESSLDYHTFLAINEARQTQQTPLKYEQLLMRYLDQSFHSYSMYHETITKDLRYYEQLRFKNFPGTSLDKDALKISQYRLLFKAKNYLVNFTQALWVLSLENPKIFKILAGIHSLIARFSPLENKELSVALESTEENLQIALSFCQGLGEGYQEITNQILDDISGRKN